MEREAEPARRAVDLDEDEGDLGEAFDPEEGAVGVEPERASLGLFDRNAVLKPWKDPLARLPRRKGRKRGRKKRKRTEPELARKYSQVPATLGRIAPLMPTGQAALYCGYKTLSGLRKAYLDGRVKPAFRRGGVGTWMWALVELDRFLASGRNRTGVQLPDVQEPEAAENKLVAAEGES